MESQRAAIAANTCKGTDVKTRLAAFNKKEEEVHPGDPVKSFRGDIDIFMGIERGPSPGRDAKVRTNRGTFYAGVFNLVVKEVSW